MNRVLALGEMAMQTIQFHLAENQLQFDTTEQQFVFDIGLKLLMEKCIRRAHFDDLAIEYLIYEIEEILEQLKLEHRVERTGISQDAELKTLSHVFFQDSQIIDRIALEAAFNQMVERKEHYLNLLGEDALTLLSYFVIIREMMHHLNIVHIEFGAKTL